MLRERERERERERKERKLSNELEASMFFFKCYIKRDSLRIAKQNKLTGNCII